MVARFPSSVSVVYQRGPKRGDHRRGWGKIWLASLFLLVGLCLDSGVGARPAYAASVTPCSSTSPTFCWEGGPVEHDPHVYLIFWGPKWTSDFDHQQVVVALEAVFGDLAGRQYTNILTQYGDNPTNPASSFHNNADPGAPFPAFDDTSTPNSNLNPVDVLNEALNMQTK
ncbi:MAG TPA: hypothetical protein VHR15_15275, partial [Ktedonobacterales bacterium]|nr:hypothetical protein [Ktedonobacterales bacterium]